MKLDRVRAFVVRDGHVLQVRQRLWGMGFTPRGEYRWVLPGGGIEDGESPEDALVREVREEANLAIEVDRLLYSVDSGNGVHGIYYARGEGDVSLGDIDADVDRVDWRPLDEVATDFMVSCAIRCLDRGHVPHIARRSYGFLTHGDRLCVFDHVEHAEAGTQVPGGGVDLGESMLDGALREVREETGFEAEVLQQLDTIHDAEADAFVSAFRMRFTGPVPETWDHGEFSYAEPIAFRFRWVRIADAERILVPGFARFIPALRASLE